MLDVILGSAVYAGRPGASVALDAVPSHREGGRVAHKIEEVVEPLTWFVLCPLVQLHLDVEYPGTGLNEVHVWRVPIQGRPFSHIR
jgi:hypothetical protein